jgi:hypothetical protein
MFFAVIRKKWKTGWEIKNEKTKEIFILKGLFTKDFLTKAEKKFVHSAGCG